MPISYLGRLIDNTILFKAMQIQGESNGLGS